MAEPMRLLIQWDWATLQPNMSVHWSLERRRNLALGNDADLSVSRSLVESITGTMELWYYYYGIWAICGMMVRKTSHCETMLCWASMRWTYGMNNIGVDVGTSSPWRVAETCHVYVVGGGHDPPKSYLLGPPDFESKSFPLLRVRVIKFDVFCF